MREACAALVGTALFWILGVFADARHVILLAMPYAIVATVFVWFRAQSYETLNAHVTSVAREVIGVGRRMIAWVIGPETQRAAQFGRRILTPEAATQSSSEG